MPDIRDVEAGTTLVTAVPLVDVLEQPEPGNPLVTQLLLGWTAQVLGNEGNWFHIQSEDGSPGWVRVDSFLIPNSFHEYPIVKVINPTAVLYTLPDIPSPCIVYLGSKLTILDEMGHYLQVLLPQGNISYIKKRDVLYINQLAEIHPIIRTAEKFHYAPYLWGGMTAHGIDCSGLTYMSYYANGHQLPRDAQDQYKFGSPVEYGELQPGDLVFFSTIDPGPSHVGVYRGDGHFINARTREGVTITPMEDPFFRPRYLGSRRYLNTG